MDAHRFAASVFLLALTAPATVAPLSAAQAATVRTPNFVVHAPTREVAAQVAEAAEYYRSTLAKEWLGREMPNWYHPCDLRVKVGQIGAGGSTTFHFDRGEVSGWRMNVQGTLERILDSVIPHEVSHTVFACHFRQPLPRWADEGAATLAEHASEQRLQKERLESILKTSRRIPLKKLLAIREYPRDMQQVLNLYAEGYSLADFLVQQGGKPRYLQFLRAAITADWETAFEKYYGVTDLARLEAQWSGWIDAGSPDLTTPEGQMLVLNDGTRPQTPKAEVVVRGQSPPPSTDDGWKRPVRNLKQASDQQPVNDQFLPPRRSHLKQVPARGELLQAPDPRHDSSPAQPAVSSGRQRAMNDGWTPIRLRRIELERGAE